MKTLLINKDGQQLGPYTIEEARALVLSGKILATDWAWTQGAADWVPLNDIPGFLVPPPPPGPAPASPVTTVSPLSMAPGTLPATAAEEQVLWSGSPSQLLHLRVYVLWALGLIVVGVGTIYENALLPLLIIVAIIGVIHCLSVYLHNRSLHYVVSNQRVRTERGLLSKDVQELELFRVKDTSVHQTFYLRLLGLGNIRILSADQSSPDLLLSAVPKSVELRERLRQEVLILRQKFGSREVDVT